MRAIGLLMVLAACGAGDDPCKGVMGTCKGLSEGASAADVQKALIEIEPGGTVAFGAGTFDFKVDLSLSVDNVTIQGAGMDKTILSFAHQTEGAQGLLVTANGFTMKDIAVEDTPGDAVKILGGDKITLLRTRALIKVRVPPGRHAIQLRYGRTPLRAACDAISFLALFAVGTMILAFVMLRSRRAAQG